MSHRILLLLSFLFLVSAPLRADIVEEHAKPTLSDGFDRKGLVIIGAGVASTLLAQSVDYQMRDTWSNYQRMNNSTARVGDFLGTGVPGSLIALSQIFLWDQNAGIAHAEALFDTFVVTSVLKHANQRGRPNSENKLSMPSGHTSTTFATATSLTYFYGWKAAVPAYFLAALTAASRWADDAHWFSDTVAGAFVGYFWGRATALHHLNQLQGGRITPYLDTKSAGLLWRREF